jgi:uroporphyrinogen-III decarboxylase
MSDLLKFKCLGENSQPISESIINENGLSYEEIHKDKRAMVIIAEKIKKLSGDCFCKLPFCATIEADALGACIKLGDFNNGPRVDRYVFSSIEELDSIGRIDFKSGRIGTVLDSVEILSNNGEQVILNVEGPFTIIASLIEPVTFYKALRKNKSMALSVLKKIEDNVTEYMFEAIKRGARIISYADPMGTIDILGPYIFKEFSAISTINIIKGSELFLNGSLIHICGKLTSSLETLGLCKIKAIYFKGEMTYGEVIDKLLKVRNDVNLLGNSCIKMTPESINNAAVYQVELQ